MTYFTFNIKIKNQDYNKKLYDFCKYYENIIVAITYSVKSKIYEIIVDNETTNFIKDAMTIATKIFKDLTYDKDYESYYIQKFKFYNLEEGILYGFKPSHHNPRMYLYFNKAINHFKIEKIPIVIFDILYNFTISDMKEIFCWSILFIENLEYKNYEMFINSCIERYYDKNHKIVNINQYNSVYCKNKTIPHSIKKFIRSKYYDKDLKYSYPYYPHINIEKIPYYFKEQIFTKEELKKIDSEFKINTNSPKEKEIFKTIQKDQEMEFIDCSLEELDDIVALVSTNKENSIIENNIFNDDEEDDKEYLEIVRTRRIKKSFMIND